MNEHVNVHHTISAIKGSVRSGVKFMPSGQLQHVDATVSGLSGIRTVLS